MHLRGPAQEWQALGYLQRGDPEEEAEKEGLKWEVAGVLMTLTDLEARVLALRYGLDDGKSRTLEEVGREFGVSRECVQQVEAQALGKLRHPSWAERLRDFCC